MPGANTVNFATHAWRSPSLAATGAMIAVAGLMGTPLVILIAVAMLYARYSYLPDVRAGLMGAATAAAGLTLGTALKLLKSLDATLVTVATAVCVCLAAALVQAPMLLILAVAIPATLAIAIRKRRIARP